MDTAEGKTSKPLSDDTQENLGDDKDDKKEDYLNTPSSSENGDSENDTTAASCCFPCFFCCCSHTNKNTESLPETNHVENNLGLSEGTSTKDGTSTQDSDSASEKINNEASYNNDQERTSPYCFLSYCCHDKNKTTSNQGEKEDLNNSIKISEGEREKNNSEGEDSSCWAAVISSFNNKKNTRGKNHSFSSIGSNETVARTDSNDSSGEAKAYYRKF